MKSLFGFGIALAFAVLLVFGCNSPAVAGDTFNGMPVLTSNPVAGVQAQDLTNTNTGARVSPFRQTTFGFGGAVVSPFGFRGRERERERIRLRDRAAFDRGAFARGGRERVAVNVNVFERRRAACEVPVAQPRFRSRRVVTEEETIEE